MRYGFFKSNSLPQIGKLFQTNEDIVLLRASRLSRRCECIIYTIQPIFSTLDLIDTLVSKGSITPLDRSEYRTLLRRAGYFFVPINADELAGHLEASTVKDEKVIETAELKAIRESILHTRMSTWLQLPEEALWLDIVLREFIQVLKGLWRSDDDLSNVWARSDWILNQVDARRWAHSLGGEYGDNIVKNGRGAHILMVIAPLVDTPREIKDKYWSWVKSQSFDSHQRTIHRSIFLDC